MSVTVTRVVDLPDGIGVLAERAAAEGQRFVARLCDDFATGNNRFAEAGEGLFEATVSGGLVGVGGLNQDPYTGRTRDGRVRRFYVLPDARRHGVGRALLAAIQSAARPPFDRLTLYTASDVASAFYVSAGFTPSAEHPKVSHWKALR